jgi:hypothetical protein
MYPARIKMRHNNDDFFHFLVAALKHKTLNLGRLLLAGINEESSRTDADLRQQH